MKKPRWERPGGAHRGPRGPPLSRGRPRCGHLVLAGHLGWPEDCSPQHALRPAGWTTAPSVHRGCRAFKMAAPRGGSGLDTDSDSDSSGEAAARFREAAWDCAAQAAAVRAEPGGGEGRRPARRPARLCSPAAAVACPALPSPPVWAGPRRSSSRSGAVAGERCSGGGTSLPRCRCRSRRRPGEPRRGSLRGARPGPTAAGCPLAVRGLPPGLEPLPRQGICCSLAHGKFPFTLAPVFPRRWAWIVFQA